MLFTLHPFLALAALLKSHGKSLNDEKLRTLQASAYEACDRMHMPLHTPETLEACKKTMPSLIKKASRCAADRTSKTTTFFIFHFL